MLKINKNILAILILVLYNKYSNLFGCKKRIRDHHKPKHKRRKTMKKLSVKLLALLLMAILAVSMFAACIVEEPEDKKPLVDDTPIDTREDPKLPAKDYGGYEFTFITQEGSAYNINFLVSEGNSSEPLDDAIARRNALVEEKYNIKICQTRVTNIDTEVRTQMMGGNVEFDAIITKCQYLAAMAQENLLYDMLKFDLFNWDASYWDSNSKEQLTLGGKLYFANCALNIDTVGYVTYFNKKMIQDYGLTSPFEYMKNNEWTIENWAKLTKSVSKDLDNDGVITYTDQVGSLAQHHLPRMMLYGAGVRATTLDENGYPRLSLMDDADKTVAIYDMVKDAITDPNYSYCITCSPVGENGFQTKYHYLRYMFTQDHFLFNYVTDSCVKEFANMESEFGIIPYPKYDKNQETYMADYPYNNALFAFPSIMPDPDRTARIIEDMNYFSTYTTIPTWYDKLLESRYARCEDSAESLKILRGNAVYDLALFYNFNGLRSAVLDVDPAVGNIARNYEKFKKPAEIAIKKVVADLQDQK